MIPRALNGSRTAVRGWSGEGGQRGSALVGAMAFLLATGILSWGYLRLAAYDAELVRGRLDDAQIRWAAEAALSMGLARANRTSNLPAYTEFRGGEIKGYPTRCRIRKLVSAFPRYLVTAYADGPDGGTGPLCSLTAVVQAGNPSDHFYHDSAHGNVYFFTGDTIDGPVHTNTRFAIAGSPVFLDPVFEMGGGVAAGFVTHPDYATRPILVRAKPKDGPIYRFDHLSQSIRGVDPAWVIRPEPGQVAEIRFKGSIMELRYRDRMVPDGWSAPIAKPIPKAGGLFVDGEVEVQGTLGRTLTLGASGNIVITDDLVYADSHPVTAKPNEASTIFLGLISEKNVNVRQVQTSEGRGRGIRINASIVAMDKSFQVVNFRAHSWDMGTMRFWGTLTQVVRGGIGSVKANETFRGYHKDWHYDRRIKRQPGALPYFPPLLTKDGYMTLEPIYYGPAAWVNDV